MTKKYRENQRQEGERVRAHESKKQYSETLNEKLEKKRKENKKAKNEGTLYKY